MNKELSKKLYSELIQGKYINKRFISNKEYLINPLFEEIDIKYDHYKEFYDEIGYDVIKNNNYYYLKSQEDIMLNVKQYQIKEYITLLALIRIVNQKKLDISLLTEINKGFDQNLIDMIYQDQKLSELLTMVEISNSKYYLDVLKKKNIIEENYIGKFVLTDIGKDFIEKLKEEGKQIFEN